MEKYQVQVRDGHYTGSTYLSASRWSTYSLIVEHVLNARPKKILEIGPGPGILSQLLTNLGFEVKTLDFDSTLKPDYLMSLTDITSEKIPERFDLIIASEVFEHVRYQDFLKVLPELSKISKSLLLTLPNTDRYSFFFGIRIRLPLLNKIVFMMKLRAGSIKHKFDGQHYWEIGKAGYSLKKIRHAVSSRSWEIEKCYYNIDKPFHHFFILKSNEKIYSPTKY